MKMLLEFDHKKAIQVINYFAKKEGGQIDKLKLIKLVYFADRYHLRRYGRPMLNDVYFAMPLGPVGSSVKDIAEFSDFLADEELGYASKYLARGGQDNIVVSISNIEMKVFSDNEIKSLDFAYSEFGQYTASKLVNITHRYPEWDKFKSALSSKETTREHMSYSDFFKDPISSIKDKFVLADNILTASKELYEEDYKIAEYWK